MGQQKQRNRRWVLASRPHGAPVPENFRLEEDDVATPGEGQVLLRTVYLSLDPYMRGRMSDEPSYSPPVDIGGVMVGGTVSRVVESNHPDYQPGDWVLGYSGWQDYDISSGDDLVKLGDHYSAAIFLIPICISFDTAEKRRYATYLILNRRFSFEF